MAVDWKLFSRDNLFFYFAVKIVYQKLSGWWQKLDALYAGDTPSAKDMKSMSLLAVCSSTSHIFLCMGYCFLSSCNLFFLFQKWSIESDGFLIQLVLEISSGPVFEWYANVEYMKRMYLYWNTTAGSCVTVTWIADLYVHKLLSFSAEIHCGMDIDSHVSTGVENRLNGVSFIFGVLSFGSIS